MEKLCRIFLRAAAKKIREVGFARGTRLASGGEMCMLGAMDFCGVKIPEDERRRIEAHICSLLPERPSSEAGYDRYNTGMLLHPLGPPWISVSGHIAWWNNMIAKDGEEVARKFEEAAESC